MNSESEGDFSRGSSAVAIPLALNGVGGIYDSYRNILL